MQTEARVFLEDILAAAIKVEKYTKGLSFDEFVDNDLVCDAVIKSIFGSQGDSLGINLS
jgi:uncharacterized protein with HEPN domain